MEFYEWFVQQCAEHNVSPSAVAVAVGVSTAAATGWKRGSMPQPVVLKRMEDYFGEKFTPPGTETLQTLRDDERALLHSYRGMTYEQKHMMGVFIRGLKQDD